MSIILRALKKIQNQGLDEQSAVDEQSAREPSDELSFPSELRGPDGFSPAEQGFTLETDRGAAHPQAADTGIRIKSSKILWMLLGLIAVLGLFATVWFASEIYKNFQAGSTGGLQAQTENPSNVEPVGRKPVRTQPAEQAGVPVAESAPKPEGASQPAEQRQEETVVQTAAASLETTPPPAEQQPAGEAPGPGLEESNVPTPIEPATPSAEPPMKEPADTQIISASTLPHESMTESAPKEGEPQAGGRPELKINAIAWRAEEPKAIVNMQRVYVGDIIEGATVKEIRRKSVVFEFQGEEFEVRF